MIGGAGMLFFTIFIVGFSFAGGVPSVAYAEDDGYALFQADDSYDGMGNFFGNFRGNCCGNALFQSDDTYQVNNSVFQKDESYANNYALFQPDSIYNYVNNYALFQQDNLYNYSDKYALFQPDGLYIPDRYTIDTYDTYTPLSVGGYGGSYGSYGGAYGGSYGGSYGQSYSGGQQYSTVSKINPTINYYTVQSNNPYYTYYPLPTCQIYQALASGYNQGAYLSWSSTNANSAYITNIGSVSVNGNRTVYPTSTTLYTMTVYGQGGSNTCSTTVQGYQYTPPVYVPPVYVPPVYNPPVYNPPVYNPPIYNNLYCTISASQAGLYGGNAVLNWTSYGASTATLSDGIGNVILNGTLTVRPESARAYTLTVYDYQGRSNTCSTVVSAVTAPYVSLTSIPYTGFDGGVTVQIIYWLSLIVFAAAAGYLVVNYRGGIQNVFAELFGGRQYAYTSAHMTPDAVILHETIIAKPQSFAARAETSTEAPAHTETFRANAEGTKDNMVLESRAGETPRLVINRR